MTPTSQCRLSTADWVNRHQDYVLSQTDKGNFTVPAWTAHKWNPFLEHFLGISKYHPTRSHRDFYYSFFFFFFPRRHLRGFIKYCMWRNSERALREALIFKPELILTEILHYRASYYRSSRRQRALHFQNKAQGVRVSLQMRRKTSAAALPLLYICQTWTSHRYREGWCLRDVCWNKFA